MRRNFEMPGRPRLDEIDGDTDPDYQDNRSGGEDGEAFDDGGIDTVDDEDIDTIDDEFGSSDDDE